MPSENQKGQSTNVTKRVHPSISTPTVEDLSGTLIFKERLDKMMSFINKPNPALCLCVMHRCNSKHFPHRLSCKMIHDLDRTKWPDARFARWRALVNQTLNLKWKHRVIDPAKISTPSANLASSALSAASTTTCKL